MAIFLTIMGTVLALAFIFQLIPARHDDPIRTRVYLYASLLTAAACFFTAGGAM